VCKQQAQLGGRCRAARIRGLGQTGLAVALLPVGFMLQIVCSRQGQGNNLSHPLAQKIAKSA
jgi:hypothetical protein